jgi:uncharacterized protein YndB with AHSA1/START domain
MTEQKSVRVRVSHRFDATAERVYDAFLDPSKAGKFLFATPTGRIVRCEIDARVGGSFTIVDRRGSEDVLHTGTYLTLERPTRIVFEFAVPKYSSDKTTVTIEIAPLARGCELTLTHEMGGQPGDATRRAEKGWRDILDVAAELLVDEQPTCGIGLAQHATVLENIAVMLEGLAETLELHRRMLVLSDENSRREDAVYGELAASWKRIAGDSAQAAAQMLAQRELPMGAHDVSAWTEQHRGAFEKYVNAETKLLGLLRIDVERDGAMLASMK